jgi:exodeoxyribonuclease VIII
MNEKEYRALPLVNFSALKRIAESPAHYAWGLSHPLEDTPAMQLGRAVHCAVLEPDLFGGRYVVAPQCDRRTKEGKALYAAFVAEAGDAEVLTQDQHEQATAIALAVRAHPVAAALLAHGEAEVILRWEDEETGIPCKGKTDWIGSGALIDLKTTNDLSPHGWWRTVALRDYHAHLAFYYDGARASGLAVSAAGLIGVEKDAPFDVGVFELAADVLDVGRRRYRSWLRLLQQCRETGIYPGRYPEIVNVDLPNWKIREDSNE